MRSAGLACALSGLALAAPALAAPPAVAVHGAGATFPAPLYLRWAADYQRQTGVAVQYTPVGSGAGIDLIERGAVDFGATDIPLPADELARFGLTQFPVVVGGVVPVVHLDGVEPGALRLTGELLADIYLGRITRWNDAALTALNPGLNLPNARITVVHRADASGTTWLFSRYLSHASPAWRTEVGTGALLRWPVGEAGDGNEGVASLVQRTRWTLGYVEYAYARQHRLASAKLRNAEGGFVAPGRESFEAAARAMPHQPAHDGSPASSKPATQPATQRADAAGWPITGASFVLVPQDDASPTAAAARRFFDWALHHGQAAASELDYVPLPAAD